MWLAFPNYDVFDFIFDRQLPWTVVQAAVYPLKELISHFNSDQAVYAHSTTLPRPSFTMPLRQSCMATKISIHTYACGMSTYIHTCIHAYMRAVN